MKINTKKQNLAKILIFLLILLILVLSVLLKKAVPNDNLVINEIVFSSEDSVDWVEIYNPTMNNLSLKGLYLSDDAGESSKYKIDDDIIIPTHSFVVIYCRENKDDDSSLVANFRISNGETIYLVAKDGGTVIDSMTAVGEEDAENFSIGRFPDGSDEIFIMSEPTAGTYNIKDMLKESEVRK